MNSWYLSWLVRSWQKFGPAASSNRVCAPIPIEFVVFPWLVEFVVSTWSMSSCQILRCRTQGTRAPIRIQFVEFPWLMGWRFAFASAGFSCVCVCRCVCVCVCVCVHLLASRIASHSARGRILIGFVCCSVLQCVAVYCSVSQCIGFVVLPWLDLLSSWYVD